MRNHYLRAGFASICTIISACSSNQELTGAAELGIDATAALVIREVYGGGSNTASVYQNDYVEIFNRSASPQSLRGLSLQYASATGTGNFGANAAQLTELPDFTLAPGQSFLVQEAPANGTIGAPLPLADYADPTPINISATAGKIALVRDTQPLGCNGGNNPCSENAEARIIDLVGFGNANYFEGQACAVGSDNANAISRGTYGCVDTNHNGNDFQKTSPAPRHSADSVISCADMVGNGGAGGSTGVTTTHTGGAAGSGANVGTSTTGVADTSPGQVRIHDIQGRAHRSPLSETYVANVPGLVTSVADDGFYFQDALPDEDEATSEALWVFTEERPTVAIGDSVLVSGTVGEYRPGCAKCGPSSSAYANLTTTEIAQLTRVLVIAQGQPLPPPIVLGRSGRKAPSCVIDSESTDVESPTAAFAPDSDGIDFYESLEGMRIELPNAIAVGPSSSYGEVPLLTDDGFGAGTRTPRGGIVVSATDFNPERIILSHPAVPMVNVGDHFAGSIVGILDYSYGNFKLYPTAPLPPVVNGDIARESIELGPRNANVLDLASLNLENLSPSDPEEKFARLAEIIVSNLGAPDLIALEEVQDNSGATNDGTVSADLTMDTLTRAIAAAGGPEYHYRSIDPVNNQDGGMSGGNIRVVFLFREDRGLNFVERPGATASTENSVIANEAALGLAYSPGRLFPNHSAFANSRKPLAGQFEFNGKRLYVIANHFGSKGGDQPLFGRFQPPPQSSEPKRLVQAELVAEFVQRIATVDSDAHIVVLGDLNDFEFSRPVSALTSAGMHPLITTLPEGERYTYVYEGNSQALDHVLVSQRLLPQLVGYDVVHVNSEFALRSSDHDPAVARFSLGALPTARIVPYVDCIEPLGRYSFVAHFGYDNPNLIATTRDVGEKNRFLFGPVHRGQPVRFLPGRNRDAFSVTAANGLLGWQLDGYIVVATPLIRHCK